MENISDLTECNVLFNNDHLILIWVFLLIDTEFDLKITFRILNPENHHKIILMKIRKMLLFSKAISVSYSFSVSIENNPCNRTKEKTY